MSALVRRLWNFFGLSPRLVSSVPSTVKEVHQAPEQAPLAKEQTAPQMASLSSKAAVMIRPHVPLIRFRYTKELTHASRSLPGTTQRTKSTEISQERSRSSQSNSSSITQEDLPARYRRRQMSHEEMDSINTGGVAAEPVKPSAGKSKSK